MLLELFIYWKHHGCAKKVRQTVLHLTEDEKNMLRQQLSCATVIQIVRPSYDWCLGLIY